MKDEQQLNELEVRIAYLEDGIDALDAVISRQTAEIDRLEKTNQAILKKLRNLDEALTANSPQPVDEPPPPHY